MVSVRPLEILLVEDDASLRLTQSMYLKREGFQVTAVGSGTEALRLVGTDQFQVVVTDLRWMKSMGSIFWPQSKRVTLKQRYCSLPALVL